MNIYLSFYWYR